MDRTRPRITLDNPAFAGRLRQPRRSSTYVKRRIQRPSKQINDVASPLATAKHIYNSQLSRPAAHASRIHKPPLRLSETTNYKAAPKKSAQAKEKFKRKKLKKPALLYAMAGVLFVLGAAISFNAWNTNRGVAAQAKKLQHSNSSSGTSNNGGPSTKPISAAAIKNYMVAPDLPRYINIPKLSVHARVLQVGVLSSGALGTPDNVFDTAWYTGSAKPGQPGATLIDGHVSSWTTKGVFYGLKDLKTGDKIQIQRGDGKTLAYKVVKSQVYPDNQVNMRAAMTPVNSQKPGLNLITCDGHVKPGTNEFDHRIIVFAEQI